VHGHSNRRLCAACEDWQVNPTEVIPKTICPNDSGDAGRGEIERLDWIGDLLGVGQDFARWPIRRWKAQLIAEGVVIGLLHELDQRRIAAR
jgi:hypothetical protein